MTDTQRDYEWEEAAIAAGNESEQDAEEQSLFDNLPEEDFTEEEIEQWQL